MGGYEIVWLGVQRSNIIPFLSLFTFILFFCYVFGLLESRELCCDFYICYPFYPSTLVLSVEFSLL